MGLAIRYGQCGVLGGGAKGETIRAKKANNSRVQATA